MAIPSYADERSHKFFTRSYVGNNRGDDGSNYEVYWNTSAEGLEPTSIYPNRTCVYCGNEASPIQAGLRRPRSFLRHDDDRDYSTTGYACCCKAAMDEGEHRAKVEELKERHEQELKELEKQAPRPDPEVFKAFALSVADRMATEAIGNFKHTKSPEKAVEVARKLSKQARGR